MYPLPVYVYVVATYSVISVMSMPNITSRSLHSDK